MAGSGYDSGRLAIPPSPRLPSSRSTSLGAASLPCRLPPSSLTSQPPASIAAHAHKPPRSPTPCAWCDWDRVWVLHVKMGDKLGQPCLKFYTNHSSISESNPRISSMSSFSRRMCWASPSWFWVALTEMSANLAGNRMDVSSQERAE